MSYLDSDIQMRKNYRYIMGYSVKNEEQCNQKSVKTTLRHFVIRNSICESMIHPFLRTENG